MFIQSAAAERGLHQSRAIQAANERWGEGRWTGRETIGIQVCKKKYTPFNFTVTSQRQQQEEDGGGGNNGGGRQPQPRRRVVKVERMFGCPHHSKLRRRVIEKHGERPGWEPFGQWSMKKAQELARRETRRLNGELATVEDESTIVTMDDDGGDDAVFSEAASASASGSNLPLPSSSSASSDPMVCVPLSAAASASAAAAAAAALPNEDFRTMCHNGRCAWKLKSKYDNVYEEILEESSPSSNNS